MYLEVYPDIVFVINFVIDFILLWLLKIINRKDSGYIRIILASVVGALASAVVSIFPWISLLIRFLLLNITTSILMVLIAYRSLRWSDLLKQVVVLNVITYFVGGLINSIYYYTNIRQSLINIGRGIVLSNISVMYVIPIFLLIIPLTILIIWLLRWYKNNTPITYGVDMVLDGRTISTRGLLDTGNCLYDPIYKKPVMVIDRELLSKLVSEKLYKEIEAASDYTNGRMVDSDKQFLSTDYMPRLRFIPYSSIGKTGMMLGINLDKILIYTGKETICNERVTVAISENHLSAKDKYHVILHKDLL